jgi:hypothetical protein
MLVRSAAKGDAMTEQACCQECGSKDLVPDVPVHVDIATNDRPYVTVRENPSALLFKGSHRGYFTATICGQCGLMKLFVSNPQELLKAHMKQQG